MKLSLSIALIALFMFASGADARGCRSRGSGSCGPPAAAVQCLQPMPTVQPVQPVPVQPVPVPVSTSAAPSCPPSGCAASARSGVFRRGR